MIVVDTSVLSLAFRRRPRKGSPAPENPAVRRLRSAVSRETVVVPATCLQELLSGARDAETFAKLEILMTPFPLVLAAREHHIGAALIANACRQRGVIVGTVDALIASLTIEHGARLLTTDTDFERIAEHSELRLERV